MGSSRRDQASCGSQGDGVSTCVHHFRSLSGDPFADTRRTVSEDTSAEVFLSKEFQSLPVDQIDVLEINYNHTRFGLYYSAKCVHVLFGNPAAYTQPHHVVATGHSVDSAAHFEAFQTHLLWRRAMDLASLRPFLSH